MLFFVFFFFEEQKLTTKNRRGKELTRTIQFKIQTNTIRWMFWNTKIILEEDNCVHEEEKE